MRGSLVASLAAAAALALPGSALALGAPGEVDPSFHGGAPVLLDLSRTVPHMTELNDVQVDANDRIVVSGQSTDPFGHVGLAVGRLDPAGNVDPSFGEGGSSVVQFGSGVGVNAPFSSAVDSFLVPGRYAGFAVFRRREGHTDLGVYEITANGGPELEFSGAAPGFASNEGVVAGGGEAQMRSAAVSPNGEVVTAANVFVSGAPGNAATSVIGFDPRGGHGQIALTTQFGRTNPPPSTGGPVAVLPDESVLVAGSAAIPPPGAFGIFLTRLTAQGAYYPSFGDSPIDRLSVLANVSDPGVASPQAGAQDLAVGPDGKVYVAGYGTDSEGRRAAVLVRFTLSGHLDPGFGSGGVRRIQLGGPEESSYLEHLVMQPDGKIVAVADVADEEGENSPRLLRFLPDGSLDPTFGSGGQVVVEPGGGDTRVASAALQDGQLLVAGYHEEGPATYGFVSRYLLSPLPDPTPPATGPTGTEATGTGGSGPGSPKAPDPPGNGQGRTGGVVRVAAKSLTVDRKGHVAVPLTCSAAGPCAGTVAIVAATGKLTGPKAKRAVTFAEAKYALAAGAKKSATLTLAGSARSRARGKRGLKARFAIEPQGGTAMLSALKLHR
jgi:uncharacterized delta-60 repeat protein